MAQTKYDTTDNHSKALIDEIKEEETFRHKSLMEYISDFGGRVTPYHFE